jgi:hypothetical protein
MGLVSFVIHKDFYPQELLLQTDPTCLNVVLTSPLWRR